MLSVTAALWEGKSLGLVKEAVGGLTSRAGSVRHRALGEPNTRRRTEGPALESAHVKRKFSEGRVEGSAVYPAPSRTKQGFGGAA